MSIEPPLVGREEELSRLTAVFKKVTEGHGAVFFISGEGGIGKTRLANEFEKKAQAAGCKVLVGGIASPHRA